MFAKTQGDRIMKKIGYVLSIMLFFQLSLTPWVCGQESKAVQYDIAEGLRASLDEPVVVALSKVGLKRWGRHQFAFISEYPDGRILLRHHAAADSVTAYGTPTPTYISSDKGKTWKSFTVDGLPSSGMTYPLFDGQFICLPMATPFNLAKAKLALPKPVGSAYSYLVFLFYRLDECPLPVQRYFEHMECARWRPESKQWKKDTILYDKKNALIWTLEKGKGSKLVPRTAFERPPLRVGRELLYADYRTNYLTDDGSAPKQWGVTCMFSQDNGRSWKRRSTIALDPLGRDAQTEPMLAENVNGELVCVIRRAEQKQKSMMITFSKDRGKTWEKPVALNNLGGFGVMPCLVRLECGVMVLSYGRPGIWLSFSPDGTGREWTKPVCMLEGKKRERPGPRPTDGYTTLLPIGSNQLLMSYSYFDHKDAQGKQRKAVLVRKLTIEGMRTESR